MKRWGERAVPPKPPVDNRLSWRFALIVAFAYAVMVLPALVRAHFDPSVFIVAGDRFVSAGRTRTPIFVRPHSAGYDGQFYYAMVLNPAVPARQAGGVTFDHPAWRWQRILYPLTAFVVSLGHARLLPAAMLAVNLACLVALGVLGRTATKRWGMGGLPAWALMVWPGFMICLTHDTTELLACACLLGAMVAWLDGRLALFAALAVGATLTRETSSLMLGGMALGSLTLGEDARFAQRAKPAMAAAACLAPVLLWHLWLSHFWEGVADAAPMPVNVGFPFAGVTERLVRSVRDAASLHGGARLIAVYAAATAIGIVGFSLWVAASLPSLMRGGGRQAAIAAGWLCMLALICVLSARGPWIDPTAIYRAFSECWVVGWLILTLSGARGWKWAGFTLLPSALMNWQLCLLQLH